MLSATASPDWQGARAAGGSCSRSVSAERGFCAVGRAVRRRISCGSCLAWAAVGSNPATARHNAAIDGSQWHDLKRHPLWQPRNIWLIENGSVRQLHSC